MKNAKTFIRYEVISQMYGLSLPENCFQEFYTLFIDGKEMGGGTELSYAYKLANIYGKENVPVDKIPTFMGFREDPKVKRDRKRFGY